MSIRHPLRALALFALLLLTALPAFAGIDGKYPELRQTFPAATRFGDLDGTPPAAAVYQGDKVIGYVFETEMVAPVPAYSGKPINILVSIDADGAIRSTRVLHQEEPILLVGIPVQKLYDFVARYVGHRVTDQIVVGNGGGGGTHIDAISSATVTSMVANETIMNAALKVAAARHIIAGGDAGDEAKAVTVRRDFYQPADWATLTGNGAIGHLHLDRAQVAAAFKGQPESGLVDDPTAPAPAGHGTDTFIDLWFADVSPPTVGRNLLGEAAYADLMKRLGKGDTAVAVMANGIYSFKGLGYVRGGIFDRVHLIQDGKLVLFHDTDLVQMSNGGLAGKPAFAEQAVFIVRHAAAASGFDAAKPWTLQLMVNRQVGPLQSIYHTFTTDYRMPAAYTTAPAAASTTSAAPAALWKQIWLGRKLDIILLVAGLGVLTLILTFQDWLVKYPHLLERLRTGYLVYTLVFIGWYSLAQLSVVNIFAFIHSVLHGFAWSTFLMDPLVFILWVFVAATLLLLGRGIYCGWLCPFGALQVLVNKLARHFKVPQFEFPQAVHDRLWAIKYVLLLVLFGISLQSVATAEHYAEVEPFKTAITLHFARSWGYVGYALALVALAAFNNKFYCRYVCPLGAGLAVSGRFHLFEWLRRRKECGHPCQICANECEVRAIDQLGRINFNECHYCLDCQVTYANDQKCPPLVERRKKRERAARPLPIPVVPSGTPASENRATPAVATPTSTPTEG